MSQPTSTDIVTAAGPSAEAIRGFYDGMRPFWHPVLASERLGHGKPVAVELLGQPVVLARLDGEIRAMLDVCRHFQAPLSLGEVVSHEGRQGLMCPYHGWTYGGDGACIRIPQLKAGGAIPAAARVPAYHVAERYGLVWVCLAEQAAHTLPDFPEYDAPGFRTVRLEEDEPTRASAPRMVMGTIDDTHFPWVHEGILGHRDHPEPPDHEAWRDGRDLVIRYTTQQPASEVTTDVTRAGHDPDAMVDITYTNHVTMPTVVRLCKDGDVGRYVIWLAASPTRWNLTTNFWAFARDYDTDPASDSRYLALAAKVRAQDKPIIEGQRPWLLPPFWTKVEMPLQPGDLPQMRYQKWLEELGIAGGI